MSGPAPVMTGLPDFPCMRCGARGWCGHDGRVDDMHRLDARPVPPPPALTPRRPPARIYPVKAAPAVPKPPLLIEQLAAVWGWAR